MNKILILGCPGSGKSTFARRLQAATRLPLFPLDTLWWRPDGTHIPRAEFDARLAAVLATGRWIIEGDYSRTYEMRLRACDTVFVLDYPASVCLEGIAARVGKARPDLPWVEHILDPALVEQVRRYRSQTRPVLFQLLQQFPHCTQIIFQSRAQADAWLAAHSPSSQP